MWTEAAMAGILGLPWVMGATPLQACAWYAYTLPLWCLLIFTAALARGNDLLGSVHYENQSVTDSDSDTDTENDTDTDAEEDAEFEAASDAGTAGTAGSRRSSDSGGTDQLSSALNVTYAWDGSERCLRLQRVVVNGRRFTVVEDGENVGACAGAHIRAAYDKNADVPADALASLASLGFEIHGPVQASIPSQRREPVPADAASQMRRDFEKVTEDLDLCLEATPPAPLTPVPPAFEYVPSPPAVPNMPECNN